MSRPKIDRSVACPPRFSSYKPTGVGRARLDAIILSIDEYEAIKLANYDGLGQEEASAKMKISRPTFTRLLGSAQKKIADFIVNGKELKIEGGQIHFRENLLKCLDCGHKFRISIESNVKQCPSCESSNLQDFARKFGHGRCCRGRGRQKE